MGVSGQRHAPAALYPRGKDPRYPLDRRLGGTQSRSGLDAGARRKILCPCRGSNLNRPIVQPVVTPILPELMRNSIKQQFTMMSIVSLIDIRHLVQKLSRGADASQPETYNFVAVKRDVLRWGKNITYKYLKTVWWPTPWEAGSRSSSQEVRVLNLPPLSHMNAVHVLTPQFCWSNYILTSSHLRLGLSSTLLPSGFPTESLPCVLNVSSITSSLMNRIWVSYGCVFRVVLCFVAMCSLMVEPW
jgi:hypothetical protein